MWVRFRVPVPADYLGPLAIRLPLETGNAYPYEIWVNGYLAGVEGTFPPHRYERARPGSTVFDLPAGSITAGQTALVARRVWYPPVTRVDSGPTGFRPEIGSRDLLRLSARDRIAEDRLSWSFMAMKSVAFFLLGAALLGVWHWGSGPRDLLWFAIYLLASGAVGAWQLVPQLFRPELSGAAWATWKYLLVWCSYVAEFEFMWAVFGLTRIWPLRALEAASGGVSLMLGSLFAASVPAAWVPAASSGWGPLTTGVRIIVVLILAWQFKRSTEMRGVAAAMIVWNTLFILADSGWGQIIPIFVPWGAITINTEDIAGILFVAAVGFLLLRRLWKTWGRARELDAEFEAARQMQQSLVPPASGAHGFTVASVYLPAREVGGDFFWTLPAADGSLLLVAGDVSGKGLKAAMTVATLAGALRDWSFRQPAEVLAHLNSVLTGHGGTGFTTCCAALFKADGSVTIANAGHLPPYRNGEELRVEPGLPLGLIAEPDYAEIVVTLRPGDELTFVSDGVVEARNASGEIYGFDRMRSLSTQPAARIAETARAFGQEDDISVITIERSAVVARAA